MAASRLPASRLAHLLGLVLLLWVSTPSYAVLVTQSQPFSVVQVDGNQEYTFVYSSGTFVPGPWDDIVSSTYDTGLNFNFNVEVLSSALVGGTLTFGDVTFDSVAGKISSFTFFNAGTANVQPWAADAGPGILYGPTTITLKVFGVDTSGASLAGGPGSLALTFDNTPPIPEPTTWLMMLAGLGAVGLKIYRAQGRRRAY